MKKFTALLLSCMLVILSLGPVPTVKAASFPGAITGSTATSGLNGTGTITVNNTTAGATLRLTPRQGGTSATLTSTGGTDVFTNVEPGIYTVTQEYGGEISSSSNEARVLPAAVVVAAPNQSGVITVSGAKAGAELLIIHDKTGFLPRVTTANDDGIGFYNVGYSEEQVPPGKNYRVKQKVNGVESAESNSIDIAPERVRLTVTISGAGANNSSGAIQVDDTRKGNRLFLYKVNSNTEPVIRVVEAENSYTFTGLSAGEYYVVQEENGALSPQSNYVSIIDEMAPTITLNGPSEDKVSMPKNYSNWEYPVSNGDVTASDNISTPTIEYKVNPDRKINTPGVYTITYTATDAAGNKTNVTKKVTVAPPVLEINKVVNTYLDGEQPPGRATGDIHVDNVMGEATIRVYQDPGGKPIKTITRANDSATGIFEVTEIPVGTQYYVTQVVNGIESEPSPRVNIIDNTKPIITIMGDSPATFTRGDSYIEYGAVAIDNVDTAADISSRIVIDRSDVNMDVPGEYIVTYNVTDNAGNTAVQAERKVTVKPHAVVAIGSNAELGEVGVKNAFPGVVLKLYSTADPTKPIAVSPRLPEGVTTYVFKTPTREDGTIINPNDKIPPGSYYVVQIFTIEGGTELESIPSNIVDVRDTNRPYITVNGAENMEFTWNESKDPYTFNGTIGQFEDPGAIAEDYLDKTDELTAKIKKKIVFGKNTICDENIDGNPTCPSVLDIDFPGVYTITYSVTTKRGTKADDKIRTITVKPPKIDKLEAEAGKSTIEVDDIFVKGGAKTEISLYNKYNQLIQKTDVLNISYVFKDIPADLGYYVTQTVNGIESARSNPINVTIANEANGPAFLTSFEFNDPRAVGVIDHEAGTINVVVPKNTDVTKLKAVFTAIGTVKVNGVEQRAGVTENNFLTDVLYKVHSTDGKTTKDYKVTVTIQSFDTEAWTTTVRKNVTLGASSASFTLTTIEAVEAKSKGVSFIAQDRAVHIPAANVIETNSPTLTIESGTTTTIRFGHSQAYVQPIELELQTPAPQAVDFVRYVQANGTNYRVVQPSQRQGSNLVGLVTEQGTYGTISSSSVPQKPIITAVGSSYTLSASAGSAIYYTTSSKAVTFDRSARNERLSSYLPILSAAEWTRYTGGTIEVTSGELYAYAVNNGVVSPISAEITKQQRDWGLGAIVERPVSHVFKVTFNAKVNRKALYNNLIYVKDDVTGTTVATRLEIGTDGKTINIIPLVPYTRGKQYTLYIDREFKGNTINEEFLQQPYKQTFIAK